MRVRHEGGSRDTLEAFAQLLKLSIMVKRSSLTTWNIT